jgi:trk system potassium uptake protein TrkA
VLLVLNLQNLEAKRIVAKAATEYHGRILRRLGLTEIIFPERDAGNRLAEHLVAPHLSQSLALTNERELAVIVVPKGRVGCTLHSWRATHSHTLQIVAHLTAEGLPLTTDKFVPLDAGEILIVTGTSADILALGE